MKLLVNEEISRNAMVLLEEQHFEVLALKVAQEQLEIFIKEEHIEAIIINESTPIHQELIEVCPSLKVIAVKGISTENIDVQFAIDQGLHVINTPKASANAVAELVIAHMMSITRFLHQSNREMPLEGDLRFNELKRDFANGSELYGKTLGLIGFDVVAQRVASIATALGMRVIFYDNGEDNTSVTLTFFNGKTVDVNVEKTTFAEVLKDADFISLHQQSEEGYILGNKEFEKVKKGVAIINAFKAGTVDEVALVNAIEDGTVRYAALDVFESQPQPEIQLLMNPELSLTPNIATLTIEAQERMGKELAEQLIKLNA